MSVCGATVVIHLSLFPYKKVTLRKAGSARSKKDSFTEIGAQESEMGFQAFIIFCIATTLTYCSNGSANSLSKLSRESFPDGFVFGAGSSAYQYEGAAHLYGRTSSIWDTFTSQDPQKIADHSNGSVADKFYFLYKEDIGLMKQIGLDTFKFSISWSRVLPEGRISGGVNWEGVNFYNDLINNLLSEGIQPFVTIFHWDLPQALEDEYMGFLSPNILKDFQEYADFCFKEFGDRVKHWITINEPNMYSSEGYAEGTHAPGRCSDYIGNCKEGNSATEPYIVAHHMILSHALAVELYRNKYQASQNGVIGIAFSVTWIVPKYQTLASVEAASRARDFLFGWICNPITYGEYPESMQYLVGNRLPKFTEAEAKLVRGSFDFIGVNYYTAYYADNVTSYNSVNLSYTTDSRANLTYERHGVLIGEKTDCSWLYIYPEGIEEALVYFNENYGQPTIYITENGMGYKSSYPLAEALNDSLRIKYHQEHLFYLSKAVKKGIDVRGYLVWSLLDNFEWSDGYTLRYGFTYIDYKNGFKRILKHSALWLKEFLRRHSMTSTSHLFASE